MKVHTEHLDDHTVRLTVEVEPERIEKAMRQTARELAKKVRIPGFRPGKAPFKVVVRRLGHDYVFGEALERIVDDVYKEALDAAEIDPYAPGELEEVEEEGQRLVFHVAKQPDVELGDYRSIRVPHEVKEVTEEMVEDVLEAMQSSLAEIEDVDRPAEIGDQLQLGHLALIMLTDEADGDAEADAESDQAEDKTEEPASEDTEDEDGKGEAPRVLLHEHDIPYVLEDDPANDIVPGVSEHFVGAKAGDDLDFVITLPDDYKDEDLAGARVQVTAQVDKVQSRRLPELDDEFAKRIEQNKFETLDALRENIRQRLEEHEQQQADEETFREAVDKLVEGATLHYPPQMVEEIIDDYLDSLEDDLEQKYGLSLEHYLTMIGAEEDALRDQYREAAARRVERGLALGAFAREEQLSVSDAAIEKKIDEIVTGLSAGSEDEDQINALRGLVDTPEFRDNISSSLLEEQIVGHLLAIAKGEEPPVGGVQPEEEEAEAEAAETDETDATEATAEAEAPQAEADESSAETE